MNRIDRLFELKSEPILSIYFTAGYPSLNDTRKILATLQEAGVDMVEIGIPYSDPMADGPTIQQSGSQAIENGMTVPLLFEQLFDMRDQITMPVILMGYLNQFMQYGMRQFLKDARKLGVDGLIIPDLPADVFENEYQALFEEFDLKLSFLITPQTAEDRIRQIDRLTGGFIYMVSDASITGAKSEIAPAQIEYFQRIKSLNLRHPLVTGFGISSRATFVKACEYSRGAIIGSAFIKSLDSTNLPAGIRNFVGEILSKV